LMGKGISAVRTASCHRLRLANNWCNLRVEDQQGKKDGTRNKLSRNHT